MTILFSSYELLYSSYEIECIDLFSDFKFVNSTSSQANFAKSEFSFEYSDSYYENEFTDVLDFSDPDKD